MRRRERGSSLVELLVALAVIGIAAAASAVALRPAAAPVDDAAGRVEGAMHAARLQAMASASARRVRPEPEGLATSRGDDCAAADWTDEPALAVALPAGVSVTPEDWSVCFDARGTADVNLVLELDHPAHSPRRLEVLLGGATRVRR